MASRYPPETPEPNAARTTPGNDPNMQARDMHARDIPARDGASDRPRDDQDDQDDDVHGAGSASMGATEDAVLRGDGITTPEVTDMGLDERGRDQPDGREFGRGEMPDQLALGDTSETGGRPDAPHYGRSPRQGLGGAGDPGSPSDPRGAPRGEVSRTDQRASDNAMGGAPNNAAANTPDPNDAGEPEKTASGTLTTGSTLGESSGGPFGRRSDGGGGMLNTDIPASMAGAGPLGGSPARGDTMDAVADRKKFGISAPSSSGSRGIHLGVGHNSPTGESTPGMHPTSPSSAEAPGGGTPARADTPKAERDFQQMGAPGQTASASAPSAERSPTEEPTAGPYPRRETETDLPTGSGAGGSRPHLDPQFDHLPGEIGKEGRP